ncbi:hypothetical protein LOR_77c22240 [Legionella oakridgensis RV-2-2007]|nr:hypothetical protein LOR_77c22240 [Legionella oakridgensis RV-2-2007]
MALIFSNTPFANVISESESNAARILMLEQALAPNSPSEVAALFAKATKARNCAVQFMLVSTSLKNKYKESCPYWVSGTSSPWITSYRIDKFSNNKKSSRFKITYQWATAAGPFKPDLVQILVVEPVPVNAHSSQTFWITSLKDRDIHPQ